MTENQFENNQLVEFENWVFHRVCAELAQSRLDRERCSMCDENPVTSIDTNVCKAKHAMPHQTQKIFPVCNNYFFIFKFPLYTN